MKTSAPSTSKPLPAAREPNGYPAVVETGALYPVEELAMRLRWRRHSLRQAKKLGLPTIRFGSRDYVIGRQAIEWFEKLSQQQADP